MHVKMKEKRLQYMEIDFSDCVIFLKRKYMVDLIFFLVLSDLFPSIILVSSGIARNIS